MHLLKTLPRHAGTASLMVLQVATLLAIVVNCVFVIGVAVSSASEDIGIDEGGIGMIQSIGVVGAMGRSTQANNLVALSQIPGVVHASFGPVPLIGHTRITLSRGDERGATVVANTYRGVGDYQATLGVRIVEGAGLVEKALPVASVENPEWPAVISQSLRKRLFHEMAAVGQLMRAGNQRFRVVGVMEDVVSALPARPGDRLTMLTARQPAAADIGGLYLIRTSPEDMDRVLPLAVAKLRSLNPGHVQPLVSTFSAFRERHAAKANSLAYVLAAVVMGLVLITACGIGTLTAHWVRQRRTSMGIRRALGARSIDIIGYFLAENAMLTGLGLVSGAIAAVILNRVGMRYLDLPPLSWPLCIASVLGVLAISLSCAAYPAWRASRVAPVEALRLI